MSDYTDLVADMKRYTDRDDVAQDLPRFIKHVEADMNRRLRTRHMMDQAIVRPPIGSGDINLPSDFLAARNASLKGCDMEYLTPEQMDRCCAGSTQFNRGGTTYYTIIGNTMRIMPIPAKEDVEIDILSSPAIATAFDGKTVSDPDTGEQWYQYYSGWRLGNIPEEDGIEVKMTFNIHHQRTINGVVTEDSLQEIDVPYDEDTETYTHRFLLKQPVSNTPTIVTDYHDIRVWVELEVTYGVFSAESKSATDLASSRGGYRHRPSFRVESQVEPPVADTLYTEQMPDVNLNYYAEIPPLGLGIYTGDLPTPNDELVPDPSTEIDLSPVRTVSQNWVSHLAPDVYLNGCMAEASAFYYDDNRSAQWRQKYERAIDQIKLADSSDRWSGGTLQTRIA